MEGLCKTDAVENAQFDLRHVYNYPLLRDPMTEDSFSLMKIRKSQLQVGNRSLNGTREIQNETLPQLTKQLY